MTNVLSQSNLPKQGEEIRDHSGKISVRNKLQPATEIVYRSCYRVTPKESYFYLQNKGKC